MTPFEILFKIGSRFPSLSLQPVCLHCAPQCLKAIFGIDPWPKYLTPSSMLLDRQWISLASLCSWLVGLNTRSLKSRMPLPSSISCEQLPGRRVRLAKDGKSPIVHACQTRRSGPTFIRLWKLPMIELSKEALLISIPALYWTFQEKQAATQPFCSWIPGQTVCECRGTFVADRIETGNHSSVWHAVVIFWCKFQYTLSPDLKFYLLSRGSKLLSPIVTFSDPFSEPIVHWWL